LKKLSTKEIVSQLKSLKHWYYDKDAIRRGWEFSYFIEALKFIILVGSIAEKHNHHPEIINIYKKVSIRFNTHDVKGVTDKDMEIARVIDQIDHL